MFDWLMDPRFTHHHYPDDEINTNMSRSLVYAIEIGETDVIPRILHRWPDAINDCGLAERPLNFAALKGNLAVVLQFFQCAQLDVHCIDHDEDEDEGLEEGDNGLNNALNPYLSYRFNGSNGGQRIPVSDEQ